MSSPGGAVIVELADVHEDVAHADVAVVGAGFAGIDLAVQLGRRGVRVLLIEAGRDSFDPAAQDLARFRNVGKPLREPDPEGPHNPYLDPRFRGETRIRQLGGTSTIWTGKWRLLNPLTFQQRDWVPGSGWPVSRAELLPFHAEVARDHGIADVDTLVDGGERHPLAAECAAAGIDGSLLHWQASPLRMAERYRAELRDTPNVQVLLGATVTELVLDDAHRRVRTVRVASPGGRRADLTADQVVLATGGLEPARLLLASYRQVPEGIGNAHGLVGRYFQDHPKTKRAVLRPSPALRGMADWLATDPLPRDQLLFGLSLDEQREHRLLDHAVSVRPVFDYELDYPAADVIAVREALRTRSARGLTAATLARAAAPRTLRQYAGQRVHRRRRGRVAHYATAIYLEQAPNPESRLRLGPRRDALGMPELEIDWQLSPLDHESFARLQRLLPAAFARAGLGELDFGPDELTLSDAGDANHHIGATRMAARPEEGVVDRDCRVFGTDNLYIATASVFPTGECATPTFTIMALARRLSAHLLSLRDDDRVTVTSTPGSR
ncbi:FAD-dependent oxidoreductase [Modestobacter sp. VKM Ac-2985]|uniref:FAD-dependent oxidoreductase n=1 Tax=Modestobacter sp. VKM Ac-2985 TaxID=3004139 RepID=UPI0022ABBE7C|nr:GMC family oxidoreductase [Modestobacter sp. VKM Ac-2985]MCZ2837706.1 GMC family oxidoreductase [Modestobacter sp. VKM Ac-2985]